MSAASSKSPSQRAIVVTVLVAVAIAVAVLLGLQSLGGSSSPLDGDLAERIPPERFVADVADAWANAWVHGDADAMTKLVAPPADGADIAARVASFRDGLRITALRASPRSPTVKGTTATVELDVAADLQALGTWTYATTLTLTLPADAETPADWKVAWSRSALHPALTGDRRLAVTRDYAPRGRLLAADGTVLGGPLAGRVGTAEADGDDRVVGDPAGVSGLQAAFDRELGGSPSGDVHVVEAGAVVKVLDHIEGRAPVDVRTSLIPALQGKADALLSGLMVQPREGEPAFSPDAAIVAMRPSTGEVLAVASKPANGFNRALNGRYPPGSTFKVITSTALLTKGITLDSPTTCPPTVTVNGREFSNAEDEELGDIPFRTAFAHSCNTAFIQLAEQLDPNELKVAAERFGFNSAPGVELPVEAASFPDISGLTDQVSSAIGQGRVLATPLQMASVAATVASGTHRPATFLAFEPGAEVPLGDPLPPGVAASLQELMRLVVSEGTGTAARLPDPPVAGKTGTAEFGTASPPHTHAWFIGFRGDLAVAVIVEDGGFGGAVAAPIAREMLR